MKKKYIYYLVSHLVFANAARKMLLFLIFQNLIKKVLVILFE